MLCLLVITDLLYLSNFTPICSFLAASTTCPKHGFFGLRPVQSKIPFLILDKLNKAVYIVT